ncbi:Uma2 family endonuclease [Streptomyces sp.]|uniref:Uma2 family endonuclease n=1 Tax=Streptomyces sp. TaxID=1931 RepID=UPI002F92981E
MTVVETDRIDMADHSDELTLDTLFEWLERLPVPEGYKVEIVGGNVYMTPQRSIHWQIIRRIIWALEDRFGRRVNVLSDVRIDFPGGNGFCPDVAKLREDTEPDGQGHWRYQDVEFVAEVISRGTAVNDYGPKKDAYAAAGVPIYLIADPYTSKWIVYSLPEDGEYTAESRGIFGLPIDLTKTPLALTLNTNEFPHD